MFTYNILLYNTVITNLIDLFSNDLTVGEL